MHFNGEFVECKLLGLLTDEDLLALAREVEKLESEAPMTPHRITDMTEVTAVNCQFDGMERMVRLRRAANLKNPIRSAIIATQTIQYGFARMFQTLNDNPRITINLFQDETTALAWLRAAPAGEDAPNHFPPPPLRAAE